MPAAFGPALGVILQEKFRTLNNALAPPPLVLNSAMC
jgi:hypothetical protein